MAIADALLPEFDHEFANTRRSLERVPDDRFAWKPHEKSSTLGALATHLANLPSWTIATLTNDTFDLAPEGKPLRMEEATTREQVLEIFDRNIAGAREAIATADDGTFGQSWTLLSNGTQILSLPKVVVIRNFVLNHNVHHRAQLGVYLRLLDVPVPSIYGPSADEGLM